MHMRHAPAILIILLLLPLVGGGLAAPCAALAADEPGKTDLIMFIANADVPPYFMEEPEHQGSGILVDVLKAVIEPLDYTFTIKRLPDKRGWHMLENGGVDVYASAPEWVSHPDRFLWTDPFMINEDVLLYPAESTLRYARPEDLYGRTVAGIKGFAYPALEPHFGPGKVSRLNATSPDAMLKLLLFGRADAVLVNRTEILWMFRNRKDLRPQQFRLDETPVERAYYRFLFSRNRGWEPVLEQFNRRLETMKQDGSLEAVLDQYR